MTYETVAATVRTDAERFAAAYTDPGLRAFVTDLAVTAGFAEREFARSGNPRRPAYTSYEQLVLSLAGTAAASRVRPCSSPPGPRSFNAAADLARTDPCLIYVEGYAQAATCPVPHAWCVHMRTGRIHDPAWSRTAFDGTAFYLGLRFSADVLAAWTPGRYGSLLAGDADRGHPALRTGLRTDADGMVTGYLDPAVGPAGRRPRKAG